MELISEFKKFAMKGNVIDLAVGVIIGAAFGKVVNSFIEDVITPLILQPVLNQEGKLNRLQDLTIFGSVKYGMFLSAIINFVVIAFVLFLFVKALNAARLKQETLEHTKQEQLLTEIRDLLKK